jgi:hypothetical protein
MARRRTPFAQPYARLLPCCGLRRSGAKGRISLRGELLSRPGGRQSGSKMRSLPPRYVSDLSGYSPTALLVARRFAEGPPQSPLRRRGGCQKKLSTYVVQRTGTLDWLAPHNLNVVRQFAAIDGKAKRSDRSNFKPRIRFEQAARRAAVDDSYPEITHQHCEFSGRRHYRTV